MPSLSLKDKIETKWDDETLLNKLKLFLNNRVKVGVQFDSDEDGLIHGYTLVFVAGDKTLPSAPVEFGWPLQTMPIPQAFEGRLH